MVGNILYAKFGVAVKNIGIIGFGILVLVIVGAIFVARDYGEPSPILAAGSIEISPELEAAASPLDTLFLIFFDQDSQMPMPYGAIRYKLNKAAQGEFHKFIVTPDNLNIMNPNGPKPSRFRIKAKLDADGTAGMDAAGDLVGEVLEVTPGAMDLRVKIDRRL
jgi:hypothetical protein